MGRPGFWDDQETAAKISAAHARAQRRLEMFRCLESDVDDLDDLAELADEDEEIAAELDSQLGSVERRLAELEEARLFSGEYDAGDAVVTVHAGAGGTDSQDWAEILLRMYLRWAERRGFEVEMAEASAGEEAGLKSATFIARGENAYGLFAAERGVHRLVRISPFDSSSRRHTSFAQVDVGPLVEGDVDVEIDESDLRIDTYRASGAGGQHVNKTDSAVRITHLPTGIVVQCQNERSQTQNKAMAMQLLHSKLIELEERKRSEELAKAARRGQRRRLGLADPLLRDAAVHDGQRPPHRARGRRRAAGPRRRHRRLRPRLPEQDRRRLGELGTMAAELVTVERPAAGEPQGLLVLHHGRGTDENDLLGLADVLDPERRLRVVSPRGPLQVEGWPGYHWYLVPRVGYPDPETFFAARAALAELHDRLWEETGVGPERTVLGGFSMGAVMSHALGWSGDRPAVAGVLAFSGFVPTVEGWEPSLADRAGATAPSSPTATPTR